MGVLRLTGVFRRPFETGRLNLSGITRISSVMFALMGIASGVFTYLILSNSTPLNPNPETVWSLLSLNIFIIIGLLIIVIGQGVRMRRRQNGEKRIELDVSQNDEQIVITISDTGIGWPKKDRYAVLEPYRTAREDGTGLGLSIVKKIIDDHNGRLVLTDAPWCTSDGTGASLQMYLPLQEKETVGQSKMLEEL